MVVWFLFTIRNVLAHTLLGGFLELENCTTIARAGLYLPEHSGQTPPGQTQSGTDCSCLVLQPLQPLSHLQQPPSCLPVAWGSVVPSSRGQVCEIHQRRRRKGIWRCGLVGAGGKWCFGRGGERLKWLKTANVLIANLSCNDRYRAGEGGECRPWCDQPGDLPGTIRWWGDTQHYLYLC